MPEGAEGEAPTSVIVPRATVITAEHADEAQAHGALTALVAAATGGSMQAAYSNAAESVQGRVDDLSSASQERQTDYVIGKSAGSDVTTEAGIVLVQQGQTITAEQADEAREHGVLGALVASATSGSARAVYTSAQASVHSRIEDLSSASRERQVEYVLGKVAGRDVHGDDGTRGGPQRPDHHAAGGAERREPGSAGPPGGLGHGGQSSKRRAAAR